MAFYPTEVNHQSKHGVIKAVLVDAEQGLYRLIEDFTYSIPFRGKVFTFNIPKGFYTNFATIPLFMRKFLHPVDKGFIVASTIHDFVLNEFKVLQSDLTREYLIDGITCYIQDTLDWSESADLFHVIMIQEDAFNERFRRLFTGMVKSWYILSPYVRKRFTF